MLFLQHVYGPDIRILPILCGSMNEYVVAVLDANAANLVPPQFDPKRYSLMVDWNPSEFSRVRLQVSRDVTRQNIATGEAIGDNQIFLQYVFSLGAHGAHQF